MLSRSVRGSLEFLHEIFAKPDYEKRQKKIRNEEQTEIISLHNRAQTETASLPAYDRRLIRTEGMKRRIVAAANRR
jgi:hypothetical protein